MPGKVRSDAWDAALTDVQRWRAYDQFRRAPWHETGEWAKKEFHLRQAPGRAALYRWAARMRKLESPHRIEQAIAARDEAAALSSAAAPNDGHLIDAYKALAADVVLGGGDTATAVRFTRMALDLAASQTKRAELALKARAQETKDRALKLAREKFEAIEARLAYTASTLQRLAQAGGLTAEARAEIERAMGLL